MRRDTEGTNAETGTADSAEADVIGDEQNVALDALSKPEVQVISIQLVMDMVKHEFRIR